MTLIVYLYYNRKFVKLCKSINNLRTLNHDKRDKKDTTQVYICLQ